MAITSSRRSNGNAVVVADYNALRADVLGHDHGTGEGGSVKHSNLTDGVISGTNVSHEDLNNHVQGEGTSESPDAEGGDEGVHGLPSNVYVLGGLTQQSLVQFGESTTNAAALIADTDSGDADQWITLTFPVTFGGTPRVVIMCNENYSVRHSVESVGTTGFTVRLGYAFEPRSRQRHDTKFSWLAIGPSP